MSEVDPQDSQGNSAACRDLSGARLATWTIEENELDEVVLSRMTRDIGRVGARLHVVLPDGSSLVHRPLGAEHGGAFRAQCRSERADSPGPSFCASALLPGPQAGPGPGPMLQGVGGPQPGQGPTGHERGRGPGSARCNAL